VFIHAIEDQRADALLVEGDLESHWVWKQITAAISQLRRTTRDEGKRVN